MRFFLFLLSFSLFGSRLESARSETSPAIAPTTVRVPLSGQGEEGEPAVWWDFQLSTGRGSGAWTRIRVPSCWEQEGFGRYLYGVEARALADDDPSIPKEIGHYRRTFEAPLAWRGKRIKLVFEGAMTDTEVFLNGTAVGPVHQGGFYEFAYDLTSFVQFGAENQLEVRVHKESANASINRAERRGDYWTFGGLFRPVRLEVEPANAIERTAFDGRADGHLYAQIFLTRPQLGHRIRTEIIDKDGTSVSPAWETKVTSLTGPTVIQQKVTDIRAWSAETPHLYRARLTLLDAEGLPLHQVMTRFGFRTFEVKPRDGLYLNGTKITLKGVNRHCFRPESGRTLTRQQSYADARLIKDANMNAVRMAHYPPDTHFLEACDELGLYVLDELAGWQAAYDTETGRRLVGQMVRRDVNHPSILFWDNGNEGGWNREIDSEFDRWDPQRRPVLHPWAVHSGINTDHYERYASTARLAAGPDIFLPTEFLHGLFDGGIGAGFRDYWDVMGSSPTCAGGFFWAFADEAVVRTDRGGVLDAVGNSAPDGIVGPHHEKEGSYFTVRAIWSPLSVSLPTVLPRDRSLELTIKNSYDFTPSEACQIRWSWIKFPPIAENEDEEETLTSGLVAGLSGGPRTSCVVTIPVPPPEQADALRLEAFDPNGRLLHAWTTPLAQLADRPSSVPSRQPPTIREQNDILTIEQDEVRFVFSRSTGQLRQIESQGRVLPLKNGPQVVAMKRNGTSYQTLPEPPPLVHLMTKVEPGKAVLLVQAKDNLPSVEWELMPAERRMLMRYHLAAQGDSEILGLRFDFEREELRQRRWLGRGPERVWQNRLEGPDWAIHRTATIDATNAGRRPYPSDAGFFGTWRWLDLGDKEHRIQIINTSDIPYYGVGTAGVGLKPFPDFPDLGLAFLHLIPAIGTKFDQPEDLGPQSQRQVLTLPIQGAVEFRF